MQTAPESKTLGVIPEMDNIITAWDRAVSIWYQSLSSAGSVSTRTSDSKGGRLIGPSLRVDSVDATLTWLEKLAGR